MKKIDLPDRKCTGCGVCVLVCEQAAVIMREHADGFLYPEILRERCIGCGRCLDSCQILTPVPKKEPKFYGVAQTTDMEVLKKSTSGGLFFCFAQTVIRNGGTVFGCVYTEDYHAVIVGAKSLDRIAPMHGSKYVWSSTGNSYQMVQQDLEAGKEVLYTGLPCQIAGLQKYLGCTYEKLYTMDVLCGGAPSPFAFQSYLETLCESAQWPNLEFQFRDKEKYGCGVDCTYYVKGRKHHENAYQNSFYYAFSSKSRVTWRRSCYDCIYKSIRRVSDITIGDYWGAQEHHPSFKRKEGVSALMLNTSKGASLFDRISGDVCWEESKDSHLMEKNSLKRKEEDIHISEPEYRGGFFATLREKGWKSADNRYLNGRKRKIKSFFKYRITKRMIEAIRGKKTIYRQ